MDIITPTAPRLQDSRDSEEVRKALLDMARQMTESIAAIYTELAKKQDIGD